MLFHKSLLRELRSTAGGVFAVLLTTLVTMILIRALGRAASGRVDGELVFPLIIFNTLTFMSSVLMLTIYISILIVLTRWWRDSEMVVWLTSGKSLVGFLSPVGSFLWPLVSLVAALSLFVAPWSQQQLQSYEDQVSNRGDIERISPGQFRESGSGKRVFFVENPDAENGRIGTVFVRSQEPSGREVLLISSTGRFELDEQGQQWVVLTSGNRVDIQPGSLESRAMGFDVYRIRADQSTPLARPSESTRARPTLDLLRAWEPRGQGELLLRLGLPMLALGLGVLAVPLSFVNIRAGRTVNLVIALFIYLTVTNLLTTMQAWVSQGQMAFGVAWGLLPGVLLACAAALFWWRVGLRRGPIDWLRSRLRTASV